MRYQLYILYCFILELGQFFSILLTLKIKPASQKSNTSRLTLPYKHTHTYTHTTCFGTVYNTSKKKLNLKGISKLKPLPLLYEIKPTTKITSVSSKHLKYISIYYV